MLSKEKLQEVVHIGILLTTEKDRNKLLNEILGKAMEISECDAGTLYLYNGDALEFKLMKTNSMGIDKGAKGESIDLPPVPLKEENICAYSAIHRRLINIPDVYESTEFDFTGPRKYDSMTGYRTGSMLVAPMTNMDDELVGVVQLMNASGDNKSSIPFSEDMELMIAAIASQAGVAISNMKYTDEIRHQMHAFVEAFTTAVDERTPYNATHTRKVARYSLLLAEMINKKCDSGETEEYFDEKRLEQLELAAMLHDVGKMIVPLEVMNKPNRLGDKLENMLLRHEFIKVSLERDCLAEKISEAEYKELIAELEELDAFVMTNNNAGFMPDEKLDYVGQISAKKYIDSCGGEVLYLTDYEKECLSIRKGTLTDLERETMQSHVVMTEKILDKVHFSSRYANVKKYASEHHEMLDGSGYPKKLSGDELELEVRILAVCDIYDALTSKDRPYKEPIPKEKAFAILRDMASHGQLEERLVDWLEEAIG